MLALIIVLQILCPSHILAFEHLYEKNHLP